MRRAAMRWLAGVVGSRMTRENEELRRQLREEQFQNTSLRMMLEAARCDSARHKAARPDLDRTGESLGRALDAIEEEMGRDAEAQSAPSLFLPGEMVEADPSVRGVQVRRSLLDSAASMLKGGDHAS